MDKMLNELRLEKEEMIKKRENLKQQYKEMRDEDPMKNYTLLKIRKIEDDLKTEFYKMVSVQNEDIEPSVGKVKAPPMIKKEF